LKPLTPSFRKRSTLNKIVLGGALLAGAILLSIWANDTYQWLQPAPPKLSAQDLLSIDQHPTDLKVLSVEKGKHGINNGFVIFTIKNTSTVTAKNVRVNFYNYNSNKSPYSGPPGRGADIPAGKTREYKVAILGDYKKFFNPGDPGAPLLKVSTKIQSVRFFALEPIVCGTANDEALPCFFSSTIRPTVVDISYGSIFGQKHHVLTQFHNAFLIGEVKFQPMLASPSS